MEILLSVLVILFMVAIIVSVVNGKPTLTETEAVANEIMDELLYKEAPQPPPADLFVKEEDCVSEVKEEIKLEVVPEVVPEVVEMPKVKIINPTPEPVAKVEEVASIKEDKPVKKKKHYSKKAKPKTPKA